MIFTAVCLLREKTMLTETQINEIRATVELQWNNRADQFNQWCELGRDEQDILFARALMEHASNQCEEVAMKHQRVEGTYSAGKKAGAMECAELLKPLF